MDKRILIVALALFAVAAAFLLWPSSVDLAAPGAAGGSAAAGTGPATGEPPVMPVQPPPTEITTRCNPIRFRVVKMYDEEVAKAIGAAAKAKYGTDEAVIAECEKHIDLPDDQFKAWLENDLGFKP